MLFLTSNLFLLAIVSLIETIIPLAMFYSVSFTAIANSICTFLLMYIHHIRLLLGGRRWQNSIQYFKYTFCVAFPVYLTFIDFIDID